MNSGSETEPRGRPEAPASPGLVLRNGAQCLVFLSGGLFMVFVLGVYLMGSSWARNLDEQLGEVTAARARALADAGQVLRAIDLYEKALAGKFEDPRQRIWKSKELVVLLIEEEMYEEALSAALELYKADEAAGLWAFRQIQIPLWEENRYEDSLGLATTWYEMAKSEDFRPAMALGKAYMGRPYTELGLQKRAASAVVEAFRIDPTLETAMIGGRLLAQVGYRQEAGPLLEFAIANGEGEVREQAKAIRRRLEGNQRE